MPMNRYKYWIVLFFFDNGITGTYRQLTLPYYCWVGKSDNGNDNTTTTKVSCVAIKLVLWKLEYLLGLHCVAVRLKQSQILTQHTS